jgi:hypothetical protein
MQYDHELRDELVEHEELFVRFAALPTQRRHRDVFSEYRLEAQVSEEETIQACNLVWLMLTSDGLRLNHPDENELTLFAMKQVDDLAALQIAEHLEVCEECMSIVQRRKLRALIDPT